MTVHLSVSGCIFKCVYVCDIGLSVWCVSGVLLLKTTKKRREFPTSLRVLSSCLILTHSLGFESVL